MKKVTLKTFYEIIYDVEHMKDIQQVQKNFSFFKLLTLQLERFVRNEYFYLTHSMLSRSREFLSIYSDLRKVSARQLAKAKDIEIFINELLEGLKTKEECYA